MKLFSITRVGKVGWDEASGFVVAAPDEQTARTLASGRSGDEGQTMWISPAATVAVCIAEDSMFTEPTVVLRDFKSG